MKIVFSLFVLILFIITPVTITAQESSVTDRYIVIDDINSFFEESDGLMIADWFQLYNMRDDESSKPVYIAVKDLSGVVKFSLESSSSTNNNQRRCRLVLISSDWESVFYKSLLAMGVRYISADGNFVNVEEFFKPLSRDLCD